MSATPELNRLVEVQGAEAPMYWSRPVPRDRFVRLAQDMHRAIVTQAGSPNADDALLETVIAEAVETFMSHAGHPVAAALKMSGLMRRVGAREAAIGRAFDVLDHSLRVARSAAEAYLPRLLAAHPLAEHQRRDLSSDLDIFLDQLREHARAGFDRQWSMEEISPEHAELAMRRLLFDDKSLIDPRRVHLLAFHAGRVLPERLRPVVSLDLAFPRAITQRADLVAGFSPHEVLLYDEGSTTTLDELDARGFGLVVGELVDLEEAPRALGLARRAAALVAAGIIARGDGLVRCSDVLGLVATAADPYILDLLVAKHLEPFRTMSPRRRADMGGLLLEWLETGESINEIARRHGQHVQTVHARVRALRRMLGDSLNDGAGRVELVLALRRELPGWRAEALVGNRATTSR